MQCTPQEIEEKRKQAQLKLARKNSIASINTSREESSTKPSSGVLTPQKQKLNTPCLPNKRICQHTSSPFETGTSPGPSKKTINANCSLISDQRFIAELTGFSTQVVDIFKTIPSRHFDLKSKSWNFDLKDYELLIKKLEPLRPNIIVGQLPQYVLNCCRQPQPDYNKFNLHEIDSELRSALMPFQEDGVCFGIDKGGRCLIGDEMGLGKTFQALAIAQYFKRDWPLLVVTTASMKNTWEETIHKYMPSISVMDTQYMTTSKDFIGDSKILIVSHDMMGRAVEKLLQKNFGTIIIDESHILKNFKTKVAKAATDLTKKCKRVILLSGTPALSRPSELFTQLSIIDDKFFGNFIAYSKRYCDGKNGQFGWDAMGKSNLHELEIVLSKKFMIRRTKEQVLKSLPNKTQEVVTLDTNLQQLAEHDRKSLNSLALNYEKQKAGEKHAILLSFFAESAKIKIPAVCSYILQVLEKEAKFIVFAHHQIMLNAIEKVLTNGKQKYIRIDGNTTCHQRKYFVDKFQLDSDYKCAILSITAANAGITLTSAKLVIFAELHWNPSILSQAESRAHRIGQDGTVNIKYLIAKGTSDDHIWPLLCQKQKILKEAGLFKDSFDDVTVVKQDLDKESLADCLQNDMTVMNTLDISSYFISPVKKDDVKVDEFEQFMNDDFDECLKEITFDF